MGRLSAVQIHACLGMRCDRGRHDDHRVQLGRLGHGRHIPFACNDGGRRVARRTGVGHLRRAIQGRTRLAAKLVEFKAITDSYKKRQFVETGGWANMPGQKTSDRRAAEGCAVALAT